MLEEYERSYRARRNNVRPLPLCQHLTKNGRACGRGVTYYRYFNNDLYKPMLLCGIHAQYLRRKGAIIYALPKDLIARKKVLTRI